MRAHVIISPGQTEIAASFAPLKAGVRRLFGRRSEIVKRANAITGLWQVRKLCACSWREFAGLVSQVARRHYAHGTLATWAANARRERPLSKYGMSARARADIALFVRALVQWLSQGRCVARVVAHRYRIRVWCKAVPA